MGRSRDHLRGCKHDEAGVSGEGRAAQARRSGCVPGHPNGCHQKPRLFPTDSRGGRRHLRQRHSAGSARPSTARARSRVRTPGPSRGAGRPVGRLSIGGVRGEASALGLRRRGHGLNPGTEPSDWRAAAGTGRAGREAGPAPGRCRLGWSPALPGLWLRILPSNARHANVHAWEAEGRPGSRLGARPGGAGTQPGRLPPGRAQDPCVRRAMSTTVPKAPLWVHGSFLSHSLPDESR